MIQEGELGFIEEKSRKGSEKREIELKLGQKKRGIEDEKGAKSSKENDTVYDNLGGSGNDGPESMMGREACRTRGSPVEELGDEQSSKHVLNIIKEKL
ncbi:hypothetical protein V6N13_075707 [Hibiscus sabdariffa]